MKKIITLCALLMIAFLLVACGDTGPKTEIPTAEQVTLTYSSWDLGAAESESPNMNRLMIQAFMEKYTQY